MIKRNPHLRSLVRERDSNLCCNCGEKARDVHHIVPLAVGGNDVLSNMVCLCKPCHNKVHNNGGTRLVNLITSGKKKDAKEKKERKKPTILPEFEKLLIRFRNGEIIFQNDPELLQFHEAAKNYKGLMGFVPGKLPTGTLRNALKSHKWHIERTRWKVRDENRNLLYYTAYPLSV